jgi:uncharacterized protein YjiS (DUF1127 family)
MQGVRTMEGRISPALLPRLTALADEAVRAVGRWSRRRRAARDLQLLNDHSLRDLGLRRADILSTVYCEASPPVRGGDGDS